MYRIDVVLDISPRMISKTDFLQKTSKERKKNAKSPNVKRDGSDTLLIIDETTKISSQITAINLSQPRESLPVHFLVDCTDDA